MPTPILATKLYVPPPRPDIVLRPRLIERLNEGLAAGRKLTIISASAGFGKTTLISEWITFGKWPVAWLSLDEGDNDLTRFLTYLVAALQTFAGNLGAGALAVLQFPQPPPTESILTTLLNDIAAISDNFILVLDDYHVIYSQAVDQSLAFLVEHQPPHMHLVIATREDPPIPLPRLRARGQLTELRAADLRFTPAEAADFLNRVMGLNLPAENIAALETRTEGWIAGLQLAALSMQGHQDTASFIKSFSGSHRFVLDYLIEEVLESQPEHIRSFLLQTSILDRFCTPLCNAVTEQEDGKEVLDVLEHSNLFLIPLDDKCQWYRYHHLFADVLQTHLLEQQPSRLAEIHLRASKWYEQNGLRPDAIHHALAAKDFEGAAGLIELAGPTTEDVGIQSVTWLGWVKRLPEELIRARPVLNVWYAYALLGRGEMEAAESRLKDAEQWLASADAIKAHSGTSSAEMVVVDKEQFKSLSATIAISRAYIAQTLGNISDTVRYTSQVLELPGADPFRYSQASMMLGMTHWASGDLEAAERLFADYTMKLRTSGNIPDAISTSVVLADIRLTLGHLHEAFNTLEQLLQFVMDDGEPIPPATADLHRELSKLYLEQGNLEAAAQHLQRSKELGEKGQSPISRYRLCIDHARLKTAQGDLEGALALLDEAQRLYIRSPLPDFYPIPAMKARIWVAQGKVARALEWVREQGLTPDDDLHYLREFEHVTLAKILIAQYQKEGTAASIKSIIRFLDRLLQAAEEGGRMGSVIEILILQALAFQAKGDFTPAIHSLQRALTLAEPEGYVCIFNEGEQLSALLKKVEKNKSLFLQKQAISLQPLFDPLSDHELEVLRLLRTEMSGPEIARNRMVSLNTIRTHTQHIYAKLGVNNRRAAVRRAEELGLL
jgi:LuxR family maltose regulon positive regulatory protein